MKITPRRKKILTAIAFVAIAVTLTGCTVPRDANGNTILIDSTTTFSSVMADESWFSAIFVWPLSQLINFLSPKIGVGLAIVLITVIVNGLLAVGTFKSTVATQEMQLIQPELEKINRKYEGRDDSASQQKKAQEMQNLYAKHHINPLGTMLVTFIQLPLIMAMYMAVQRAYAVQNGTFMGIKLSVTPLTGIKGGNLMYLVLFVIMALLQFLSMYVPQYFSKKKAEKLAEKQHRKPETVNNKSQMIMQIYMMVMICGFGLIWPTAMALYWAINSFTNVIKTILVQKYIDKTEGNNK